MSIIVDNTDVMDMVSFEDYKSYLSALDKRLKVQNLRTLMLFGEYHGSFAKSFRCMFREARSLRTIFLSGASYSVDDVFLNFSELVHLRYLRFRSVCNKDICLPSALFRLFHLEILDLEKWDGSFGSTSQMSNLVKLRHFVVPAYKLELHSSIHEVGKLKFLRELRRFEVGKEIKGFELSQLGELTELGGSLGIYNLEKVQGKEGGKELKLVHKNHLHNLTLEWDSGRPNKDPLQEENVLENLVPQKNLQHLCIRGHAGSKCPSWLCGNLSVTSLESLCLHDISWNALPPLGELSFVGDPGETCNTGPVSTLSFQCLKTLKLVKIPGLTKWVGNGTCHLFSHLEVIGIQDCPELVELPFSHPTCSQAKQEENMNWFPKLRDLVITGCPKLSSSPPIPWTLSPCYAWITDVGCAFENVSYSRNRKKELCLGIEGKGYQNGTLWNVLNFHNLADLKELHMKKCPPMPLILLQMLKYLKTLKINGMSTALLLFEGDSHRIGCPLPVECIHINKCDANGEELTQLLSYFPKLTELQIGWCKKITGLGVVEHQSTVVAALPVSSPSSSANKSEHAQDGHNQQQIRGEDEIASATQGLLLLPTQLQDLAIYVGADLCLISNSLGNENARDGLQSLCSLRSLVITGCPKFLSSYASSASFCFPFPTSMQKLNLHGVEGMETLACLSNLIYLTELSLSGCQDLRGEGLSPIVAQGRLKKLWIKRIPKFFTGSYSSKIKSLHTDDHAGVLTLPICSLLSSSLTTLSFSEDEEVERFTKEQEEALHLLNSLEELEFHSCKKLQRLPAGLTMLTNLKSLRIQSCPAIQLLPKDRLPSSLQELDIYNCPTIKSLPKGRPVKFITMIESL
uniref:Uncharacterized protein n=1 Tax=Avena sativa TaxID=4498 RepID=A0ACD5ZPX0_AVESA